MLDKLVPRLPQVINVNLLICILKVDQVSLHVDFELFYAVCLQWHRPHGELMRWCFLITYLNLLLLHFQLHFHNHTCVLDFSFVLFWETVMLWWLVFLKCSHLCHVTIQLLLILLLQLVHRCCQDPFIRQIRNFADTIELQNLVRVLHPLQILRRATNQLVMQLAYVLEKFTHLHWV